MSKKKIDYRKDPYNRSFWKMWTDFNDFYCDKTISSEIKGEVITAQSLYNNKLEDKIEFTISTAKTVYEVFKPKMERDIVGFLSNSDEKAINANLRYAYELYEKAFNCKPNKEIKEHISTWMKEYKLTKETLGAFFNEVASSNDPSFENVID